MKLGASRPKRREEVGTVGRDQELGSSERVGEPAEKVTVKWATAVDGCIKRRERVVGGTGYDVAEVRSEPVRAGGARPTRCGLLFLAGRLVTRRSGMELFCGVVERCCPWSNEHELKRRREEVVARILLVKESKPPYGVFCWFGDAVRSRCQMTSLWIQSFG